MAKQCILYYFCGLESLMQDKILGYTEYYFLKYFISILLSINMSDSSNTFKLKILKVLYKFFFQWAFILELFKVFKCNKIIFAQYFIIRCLKKAKIYKLRHLKKYFFIFLLWNLIQGTRMYRMILVVIIFIILSIYMTENSNKKYQC